MVTLLQNARYVGQIFNPCVQLAICDMSVAALGIAAWSRYHAWDGDR